MLLGLDIGTSSAKALLLSEDGRVLGQGTARYEVSSPQPGWAESSPDDWWAAVGLAARQAAGRRGGAVRAIGLSGQMHGVVLCEAEGTPLRPAILWADTRSSAELQLYRQLGAEGQRSLANPYVTGMAGPTLLWLREHEPEVYQQARWALQPKDWLRLCLTGRTFSEPSDASATLLYDLPADRWATAIVDRLGLRSDWLAPIVPSGSEAGSLRREVADHLGLPAGILVAAGAGDAAAAALGTGLLEPGPTQLVLGTGGQILTPLDAAHPDPTARTHLYRAAVPSRWYAMAAIQNAGLALDWSRRLLGMSWKRAYAEAFAVPDGAGGLIFLPYLTGERTPHLDPTLRGAWVGLDLHHGRPQLLRAAFEGVAFALREGLEALEAAGRRVTTLRLVGGGSLHAGWRQLLADVLERQLLAVPEAGASARGAALLAGIAVSTFADAAETLRIAPQEAPVAEPDEHQAAMYREAYSRYQALSRRLRN